MNNQKSKSRFILRASFYFLLAACSQPLLETYGCGCAGRTYTAEELARYRKGAALNDLEALAQMEEYHNWRKGDASSEAERAKEGKLEEYYLNRRIALRDPEAMAYRLHDLSTSAYFDEMPTADRLKTLQDARSFAAVAGSGLTVMDPWTWPREEKPAIPELDRQIALLRKFGDSYRQERARASSLARQRFMRQERDGVHAVDGQKPA